MPETFWKATVWEFFKAVEGHNRVNSPARTVEPMSRDRFNALVEKYYGSTN